MDSSAVKLSVVLESLPFVWNIPGGRVAKCYRGGI